MGFFSYGLYQKKFLIALSIFLIVVVTSAAFSSSLNNEFTNWDDQDNVTENLLIRDLSWNKTKEIFTSSTDYYRPLVFITYAIEYSFFGLEATAYHVTNLLLHILNTLLVFWLIFLFSNKTLLSLITALLFAVHPLHVESVAWITERKDVLSTFFFLQAIIYYLVYKEKKKVSYYYLSIFTFILALLSKPMVVTLPLVLLLCDYLFHREFNRRNLLEKIPFFVLSIIFGMATLFIVQTPSSAEGQSTFSNSLINVLMACRGIIFYLYKMVAPFSLSALYPPPKVINILSPEYFLPPILLVFLIVAIFYSRKRTRVIAFGSLFFFVTILPVIQIMHVGSAIVADRYMYIPSIGLFYIVGLALYNMYMWKNSFEKVRKVSVILFLSIVISILSVLTYQRSNVWQDSETLWLNVLENYPDVPIAHSNLGNIYADKGLLGAAVNKYREALRLNPRLFEARYNLGVTYHEMGFIDNAIVEYRKALKLNPSKTEVRNNLGIVLGQKGKYFEAISEFKKVLRIYPNDTKARYYLILAYLSLGDCKKAKGLASSFLRSKPEKKIAQMLSERCG